MRLERIMTPRPLTAAPDTPSEEVASLVRSARVRHVPVVDGGRVTGVWVLRDDEGLVLLGPEAVLELAPDVDAEVAVEAVVRGREAVVAVRDGRPEGLLTRADVLAILREALAHGHGARHAGARDPVVVLLTGPAGAGKSTLLERTLPFLGRCDTGIVRADATDGTPRSVRRDGRVTTVVDPAAAFRRGLHEAVRELGDVQVVLVEDRPRPAGARGVPGGDTQVLVVTAEAAEHLTAEDLRDTQAVVVTHLDGADVPSLRTRLGGLVTGLPVFGVTEEAGDPGLAAWGEWVLGRALTRGHR